MARISEINIETAPEAIQKIVADHVAEGHTITAEKRTLLHNAAAFNAVEAGSYALDDELVRLIGKRAADFYEYAISRANGCLVCSIYFRNLPHNYPRNCVAYPGTHDNNTLAGWFGEELTPEYRQQAREYFALNKAEGELRGMLRGVMASTAALAIIPMADWLEEPSASRMNTPGVAQGNWQWRVDEKKLTPALAREIKAMTVRYFRAPATRK